MSAVTLNVHKGSHPLRDSYLLVLTILLHCPPAGEGEEGQPHRLPPSNANHLRQGAEAAPDRQRGTSTGVRGAADVPVGGRMLKPVDTAVLPH